MIKYQLLVQTQIRSAYTIDERWIPMKNLSETEITVVYRNVHFFLFTPSIGCKIHQNSLEKT